MAKPRPTPRPRPSTPKPPHPTATVPAADAKRLLALDAAFDKPLDVPVKQLLHEARDLASTARRLEPELVAKSELSKGFSAELSRRTDLADAAERAWQAARALHVPADVEVARQDGEALKRRAFAALRYFCRADPEVQSRLDRIYEGAGDADLIDDLTKLADLVRTHGPDLKKADLPRRPADALEAAAHALAEVAAARGKAPDLVTAQRLRNRAFWWLRALLEDVRAAGRYVFRGDPKALKAFRSTTTHTRVQRKSKPPAPEPPTA